MNEQFDTPERERAAIERVTQQLIGRYQGRYPADQVTRTTNTAYRRYADARVRTFIPVLVEREVREILEHARD